MSLKKNDGGCDPGFRYRPEKLTESIHVREETFSPVGVFITPPEGHCVMSRCPVSIDEC